MMTPLSRRVFLAGLPTLAAKARATVPPAPCRLGREGCVRVGGGRRVAYAEYGNPAGRQVIFYHHGLPSCRWEAELYLDALRGRPQVRLIAFDRPGLGRSDPSPSGSFIEWGGDLVKCAAALGVDRYGLAGTSGGTPYLLAAAVASAGRLTGAALCCPVGEHRAGRFNGSGASACRAARATPGVVRRAADAAASRVERSPESALRLAAPYTSAERQLLADPVAIRFVADVLVEAFRQGAEGFVAEAQRLAGRWNLPMGRLTVPTVIFTGSADRHAPPWMAHALGRAIPNAVVQEYIGEGHYSLPRSQATAILDAATATTAF